MCGTTIKYSCGHQAAITTAPCKQHLDNLRLLAKKKTQQSFWKRLFRIKPNPPRCHSPSNTQITDSKCPACMTMERKYAYTCSLCRLQQRVVHHTSRDANGGLCCSYGADEWEWKRYQISGPLEARANERATVGRNPVARRESIRERGMMDEIGNHPSYHQLSLPPTAPRAQATSERGLQERPTLRERYKRDHVSMYFAQANRPRIQEPLTTPQRPASMQGPHPARSRMALVDHVLTPAAVQEPRQPDRQPPNPTVHHPHSFIYQDHSSYTQAPVLRRQGRGRLPDRDPDRGQAQVSTSFLTRTPSTASHMTTPRSPPFTSKLSPISSHSSHSSDDEPLHTEDPRGADGRSRHFGSQRSASTLEVSIKDTLEYAEAWWI